MRKGVNRWTRGDVQRGRGNVYRCASEAELESVLDFGGERRGLTLSSPATTIRGCGMRQVGPNRGLSGPYSPMEFIPQRQARWIVVDILSALNNAFSSLRL